MAGFDGSVPCWIPDIPVRRNETQRMRIAQFGDGYSQRTLDGINSLERRWTVTFENREKEIVVAMLEFLTNQKGRAFAFQEPVTGKMFNVNCDEWEVDWTIRRKGPRYWGTLSAEFIQNFGVTI